MHTIIFFLLPFILLCAFDFFSFVFFIDRNSCVAYNFFRVFRLANRILNKNDLEFSVFGWFSRKNAKSIFAFFCVVSFRNFFICRTKVKGKKRKFNLNPCQRRRRNKNAKFKKRLSLKETESRQKSFFVERLQHQVTDPECGWLNVVTKNGKKLYYYYFFRVLRVLMSF